MAMIVVVSGLYYILEYVGTPLYCGDHCLYCGDEFEQNFQTALENKDIGFCFEDHSYADWVWHRGFDVVHGYDCKTKEGVSFEYDGEYHGMLGVPPPHDNDFETSCLKYFAKRFNESGYCGLATNGVSKERCFDDMAFFNSNIDMCNNIKDDILNFQCISTISINRKDETLCEKLQNENDIDLCLKQYRRN